MGQVELKPTPIRLLESYLYEPISALTHVLGVLLSVVGTIVLLTVSWGEPWRVVSFTVYGLSSIALYTASSLLHSLKVKPQLRRWLLRFDHLGIFFLIAGSYTPLTLVSLRATYPATAWGLFCAVWILVSLGIFFKMRWLDAPEWLTTSFYLMLGWLSLLILTPLKQVFPGVALFLLVAGGLIYSVGAVIFVAQRPKLYPGVFEHHELWHLFVLAGGACHFLMFFWYVAPW